MDLQFPADVLDDIHVAYRERTLLHLQSAITDGLQNLHPSSLLRELLRLPDPLKSMQLAHDGHPIEHRRLLVDGCLDGGRLGHLMEQGAALLLLGLDSWFVNLDRSTQTLENHFEVDVSLNAYIGGPGSKGFGEHVDHHDVLVLQVAGEKNWRFWEPTLQEPLELPRHQHGMPTREIGRLKTQRGDILFIPRGIWHAAEATVDFPTAHLSFGFQPLTALHWLTSMRTSLMDNVDWRQEIPTEVDARRRWLERLRGSILQEFTLEELDLYLKTRRRRFHEK